MVISQKRLNFRMKRNCKLQDKMGCNGLGNRCPSQKNANLNFEISRRRRAKVTSLALAMTTDPKRQTVAAFSESAKHTPFVEGIAERGEVARSDCTRSC